MSNKAKEYLEKALEDILEDIDNAGKWVKEWATNETPHYNLVSKKAYRGGNQFFLTCFGSHFSSHAWVTFKQCQKLGGKVKKGQHGFPVFYWNFWEKKTIDPVTKEETKESLPMLKCFTVFNLDQTTLEAPKEIEIEGADNDFIGTAEDFLKNIPHSVSFGGDRAFFSPSLDKIKVPEIKSFTSSEAFYATYFHELVHWTGHETRLKRIKATSFGSDPYAKEELVAESGSLMASAKVGLDIKVDNFLAYLKHWLGNCTTGNRATTFFSAFSKAEQAVDYLLDYSKA